MTVPGAPTVDEIPVLYHTDLTSMALYRIFLGEGSMSRRAVILQSTFIAPELLTKATNDQASILFPPESSLRETSSKTYGDMECFPQGCAGDCHRGGNMRRGRSMRSQRLNEARAHEAYSTVDNVSVYVRCCSGVIFVFVVMCHFSSCLLLFLLTSFHPCAATSVQSSASPRNPPTAGATTRASLCG